MRSTNMKISEITIICLIEVQTPAQNSGIKGVVKVSYSSAG